MQGVEGAHVLVRDFDNGTVPPVYTVSPHRLPPAIVAPLSLPFNTENRPKAEGTGEQEILTRISDIGAAQSRMNTSNTCFVPASGLGASASL